MKRQKKLSDRTSKAQAASGNARLAKQSDVRKKRRSLALDKRVRQIENWHKRLAPQFPDIDPHDLHLIIASLLRTRKERMEIMFLKRRK